MRRGRSGVAFGRLGVNKARVSGLSQVGRCVAISQARVSLGCWRARKKRSIASVHGQVAVRTQLLQASGMPVDVFFT